MAQLICHHLSVGYDSKAVLTDLNFEVNEQDYLCIVGEMCIRDRQRRYHMGCSISYSIGCCHLFESNYSWIFS